MTLINRHIILTGAAGLLGSEYAKQFIKHGAFVELIDVNTAGLERLAQSLKSQYSEDRFRIHNVDITDENSVKNVVDLVAANLSDDAMLALVNNAAIDAKVGPEKSDKNLTRLENFPIEQWCLEINVGLTGAMLLCKHAGHLMAERNGGVIVNVASDLGIIAPNQSLYKKDGVKEKQQDTKPVTYSVVKHGIIGLTKYMATYWADKGVRCNAIAPGGVKTSQPQEFVERVSSLIPMGRMAHVDEYNGAMVFMLSEQCSYMNGHVMVLDGGRTVW